MNLTQDQAFFEQKLADMCGNDKDKRLIITATRLMLMFDKVVIPNCNLPKDAKICMANAMVDGLMILLTAAIPVKTDAYLSAEVFHTYDSLWDFMGKLKDAQCDTTTTTQQ